MRQRTPAYIFIPLTMVAIILAFTMVTPVDTIAEPGFKGMVNNLITHLGAVIKQGIVWAVVAIAFVMLLIVNAINRVVETQKFKQLSPEEQEEYLAEKKVGYLKKLFSSASKKQSAEEEEAIIIDHGFDGIQELDNALPQWWLSLFYCGAVFGCIFDNCRKNHCSSRLGCKTNENNNVDTLFASELCYSFIYSSS